MNTAVNLKNENMRMLDGMVQQVSEIIRGKEDKITLLMGAFLASGHVLLEDVPGVGKTTLVRALAKVLGTQMSRIQFTSDLLPADVLGVHAWDSQNNAFVFRQGPIFAELVLADEINRASPKTQSALLEAMAEKQISVDDKTFSMPELFTVIATQNPMEHHGVYPLPESQLDRFMVRIELGYLEEELERDLLLSTKKNTEQLREVKPYFSVEQLLSLRQQVEQVHMEPSIASYLLAIVGATRSHTSLSLGASTRAAIDFAAMVRAFAFISGRGYVVADDIKGLACAILAHRLVLKQPRMDSSDRLRCQVIINEILEQTPVPR